MKNLLGIILICFSFSMSAFAFDDYLVLTENPVKKIVSSNPDVIIANVLITIMNEKNTIIIQSKSIGKAVLTVTLDDKIFEIPVEVKKNKTVFKKNDKFEFIKIDSPPEILDIDIPPSLEVKHE